MVNRGGYTPDTKSIDKFEDRNSLDTISRRLYKPKSDYKFNSNDH